MTWSNVLLTRQMIGYGQWAHSVVHVFIAEHAHDHFLGGHDDHEGLGMPQCWCRPVMEAMTRGPLGLVGFMYTHDSEEP